MAQNLLKLAGLDWQVPDFSTVSRRRKHLAVTIAAHATTTGLHLLDDSTGIKMLRKGEWKTKKHGADYRRQWLRVHMGIDAGTAGKPGHRSDGQRHRRCAHAALPARPDCLGRAHRERHWRCAYDTNGCHEAIARRGARAIIPTRKNSKPRKADVLVPRPAMPSCARHGALAGRFGRTGAAITGAVWSKPRCVASSCWASRSWRAISPVRSPSCRRAPPSSIASPESGHRRRWPCSKSVWANRMLKKA
jgi:hypothetical protein